LPSYFISRRFDVNTAEVAKKFKRESGDVRNAAREMNIPLQRGRNGTDFNAKQVERIGKYFANNVSTKKAPAPKKVEKKAVVKKPTSAKKAAPVKKAEPKKVEKPAPAKKVPAPKKAEKKAVVKDEEIDDENDITDILDEEEEM
jgi:hypothetical protein